MNFFDEKLQELDAYPLRGEDKYLPTPEDLLHFEARLSGPLPADYRACIEDYVISRFQQQAVFPVADNCPYGSEAFLFVLYGLEPLDDDYGLENNQRYFVPKHPLLIADVSMKGQAFEVRLSLTENNHGEIYLVPYKSVQVDTWSYEKKYEDVSYHIADSFQEFIGKIVTREKPIVVPQKREVKTENKWIWNAIVDNDMETIIGLVDAKRFQTWNYLWHNGDVGPTMCQLAAWLGSFEALELLLDHKADMYGALSFAAYGGKLAHMKLLIERGADVNERFQRVSYRESSPPLLYVMDSSTIRRFQLRAIQLLLEHGADPYQKGHENRDLFYHLRWARLPHLDIQHESA